MHKIQMHEELKQPFIGLKLEQYDYDRVKTALPNPTIISIVHKKAGTQKSLELIYVLEGYLSSAKQYHWVASIKFAIEQKLGCKMIWLEEYYLGDTIEYNSVIYTLGYLSRFFSSSILQYPNVLYPTSSKVLYKHLCWAATKLYKKDILYRESIVCIAIRFNAKLHISEKLNRRELLNQSYGCLEFIRKEKPGILRGEGLKEAYSRGGKIRLEQKALEKQKSIIKLKELLTSSSFFKKSNGAPHIGRLAEKLDLSRQTVSKYLKGCP